jgi:CheY-like chemotaxis protein
VPPLTVKSLAMNELTGASLKVKVMVAVSPALRAETSLVISSVGATVSMVKGEMGALVVTPPYVRPTQSGLLAHYRTVAVEGGLPVVLYNVPARTGCDLLPALRQCLQQPRLPAVLCTADDAADVQSRAQAAGFDACWPKPVDLQQVLSGLARYSQVFKSTSE